MPKEFRKEKKHWLEVDRSTYNGLFILRRDGNVERKWT